VGANPAGSEARRWPVVTPYMPTHADVTAVMTGSRGYIRSPEMARRLGVSTRTMRRAFARGELPGAVEHGQRILMVPRHLLRLAEAYGLRGLARIIKAGLL